MHRKSAVCCDGSCNAAAVYSLLESYALALSKSTESFAVHQGRLQRAQRYGFWRLGLCTRARFHVRSHLLTKPRLLPSWLGESQLPPTTVRARNHLSPPARGRLVGFLLSYQTISFLNFLLDFPRIILKSKFSFPLQERMFISVLQSQGLFKSLPPTLKYTRG